MELFIRVIATGIASLLILGILVDASRTIAFPQRGARHLRLIRYSLKFTWTFWTAINRRFRAEIDPGYLSSFGPISMVVTLIPWAGGLIFGFALLQWSLGSQVYLREGSPDFWSDLYMSGVTFFTLGYGDVTPISGIARTLAVVEAGIGFVFLALVIGYVPVIYQAYLRREVPLPKLVGRAGSPPTAIVLLGQLGQGDEIFALGAFFEEWEQWVADIMDSHLSYPILAYTRSPSTGTSWLAALTLILDAGALTIVGIGGVPTRPARLAFSLGQQFAVDFCQILGVSPKQNPDVRLSTMGLGQLRADLSGKGVELKVGENADRLLADLRKSYEPYIAAIADTLLMPLPPWNITQDSPWAEEDE